MPRKLIGAALCAGLMLCGTNVADAAPSKAPMTNIRIVSNGEFDKAHGVSSGNGTKNDPYVFENLQLANLSLENTSRYVEIRKSFISNLLELSWVGKTVKVHDNTIGNLVVNRNVKRTGKTTNGSIVRNTIGVVSQLRHWDGLFARNTVGSKDNIAKQAANLDGFNGAKYTKNTFYGFVDTRLHGHHFSSGFDTASHMGHHAHGDRFHRTVVSFNRIYSSHTYALAYLDTGHAANDRTATSETDPMLNEPHAHHTKVSFWGNKLHGAGILVDVFNADDERHLRTYTGRLGIEKNTITLGKDAFFSARQLMGIEVRNVKDVNTAINGNRITGWKPNGLLAFLEQWDTNAGILLQNVDTTRFKIINNSVANRTYGIHAMNFTVAVDWAIGNLKTTNVKERVAADNVPRKPRAA